MGDVEMVCLVDGQRLASGDAGAHGAGAGARLRPFGTEIETRLAQVVIERSIAQKLDGDALTIRQQEHVILLGDLPVRGVPVPSVRYARDPRPAGDARAAGSSETMTASCAFVGSS